MVPTATIWVAAPLDRAQPFAGSSAAWRRSTPTWHRQRERPSTRAPSGTRANARRPCRPESATFSRLVYTCSESSLPRLSSVRRHNARAQAARSRSLNSRSGTSLFYQSQERPTVPRGRSRILARDATYRCWSQVNRERRAARRSFVRSSGKSCSACGRAEVRSRVQPKSCEMNSSWLLNRSIRHASGCH